MFKKIALTFGIRITIALINLAIVVMLSRYIGAAGKGEASLVVTSIAMILLFCNMVGGSSLVYFVPRHNIFQLFLWSNAWSVLMCAASYFLFLVFPLVPEKAIVPVILLSLINSFLATNLTIILGKEKINTHNLVSLLQTVTSIAILWLMVQGLNRANVDSYIYALYASMGLCLVVSCFAVVPIIQKDQAPPEDGLFAKLFHYGAYSQAGHIMKFASFRCTYYLLSAQAGDAALGVFSNGVSLVESVFLISNSIATVLYPKVSNSDNIAASQELTLKLTRLSILLCTAALIPLVLLPDNFFTWLFGPGFAGVHAVIVYLSAGALLYNIALVIGHYFSGVGKFRVNTIANAAGLITTVLGALVCYNHWAIEQIGIISSISYLATCAVIIVYFMKEANVPLQQLIPQTADFKWLRAEAAGLLKKQ